MVERLNEMARNVWKLLFAALFASLLLYLPSHAASNVVYSSVQLLTPGKKVTIGATGYVSAKSSKSSVVSVKTTTETDTDPWGETYTYKSFTFKAKKEGRATVTIQLEGGMVEKYYYIVASSYSFKYNTDTIALAKGKKKTVKATVPKGCTVRYSSSKKSVATVNSKGKITAKKKGTVTISAKVYYKGELIKTLEKKVIVTKSTPYSYNTSDLSLTIGKSKTVKAKAPDGCTVKYTTSDRHVAKVSSSGKITAVDPGTATITVKVYYKKELIKTMTKKVTVTSGYSYTLYKIGNSVCYTSNCCFYIKTGYTDLDNIYIRNNKSYNIVITSYNDIMYESKECVDGLYKVSGGYLLTIDFNVAGTNTISIYEGSVLIKTVSLNVLDYSAAEDAWIESLISEHTTSSMNSFEKMSAICKYLNSSASGFTYLTSVDEKLVNLALEEQPYFILKKWDSCISPAALAKIAEHIGGFDYIHNCYNDYSYGTDEWSTTHYLCKVGIGDDIRSYEACPLSETGAISSIDYIDFNSSSDLTRLG